MARPAWMWAAAAEAMHRLAQGPGIKVPPEEAQYNASGARTTRTSTRTSVRTRMRT